VRFRVLERWRERAGATVELTTGAGGGDCGYTFEKGVSYLVFASARAGALTTGICSRTRKLTDAAEDLAYLSSSGAMSTRVDWNRVVLHRRRPVRVRLERLPSISSAGQRPLFTGF
jgi:hypothetical protein